jgi:hypothetical protein
MKPVSVPSLSKTMISFSPFLRKGAGIYADLCGPTSQCLERTLPLTIIMPFLKVGSLINVSLHSSISSSALRKTGVPSKASTPSLKSTPEISVNGRGTYYCPKCQK